MADKSALGAIHRFTRVGFLEGQIGGQGRRKRPYAAMALPGSLTQKPTPESDTSAPTKFPVIL